MKKYYLADILSAFEILMACTLIGMAFCQVPAEIVIWFFAAGELADAFDGPCSRRWPYPDDDTPRWWREPKTVKRIEHFSDIFIAGTCMFYLVTQPADNIFQFLWLAPASVSSCARNLGLTIITICLIAELIIRILRREDNGHFTRSIEIIILARRLIYAIIGIGGGIFLLIMATNWGHDVKLTFVFAGLIIGVLLFYYKFDRAIDPS